MKEETRFLVYLSKENSKKLTFSTSTQVIVLNNPVCLKSTVQFFRRIAWMANSLSHHSKHFIRNSVKKRCLSVL